MICLLICLLGTGILIGFGKPLIGLYLQGDAGAGDAAMAMAYGKDYLWIMLLGLLPFTVVQIYASTLRETSETIKPMIAGMIAVVVNMSFNYLLIFGKAGFPALGVRGAGDRDRDGALYRVYLYRRLDTPPFRPELLHSGRVSELPDSEASGRADPAQGNAASG